MEGEGVGEEAVFRGEEGTSDVQQACEQDSGRGRSQVDKEKAEQTNLGGRGEVKDDSWPAKSYLCHPGQEGGEDEAGGGKEDGKDPGARLGEINRAGG